MGKSYTVHCVGVPQGLAMSRLGVVQAERRAALRGERISYWFAQTEIGKRILGASGTVKLEDIPNLPRLTICPICEGDGHNGKFHCPVCAGSGVCRRGNERRWHPWQIENMRASREKSQ